MKEDIQGFDFQSRLQSYIAGDLSEADSRALEQELKASKEAAEEYAFSQCLALAVKHQELLEVSNLAKAAIQDTPLPPAGRAGARPWRWGLGAAAALLLCLAAVWAVREQQASLVQREAQALYVAHIEPMEALIYTDSSTDQRLSQGMAAYAQGDYEAAQPLLLMYFRLKKDWNVALYAAICQLYLGESVSAQLLLEEVAQNTDAPIREAALKYRALAYLQQGDAEAARALLDSLSLVLPNDADINTMLDALRERPFN